MAVAAMIESRSVGAAREASALVIHAVWCVDSLHYLRDVDEHGPLHGHRQDVVDLAHVRWAAGTAVSALDLCAAALGRFYRGVNGPQEDDVRTYDATVPADARRHARVSTARARLAPDALAWVDQLVADLDYRSVQRETRNPLTHARVNRSLSTGSRTRLAFGGTPVPVPAILDAATRLATTHVEGFLAGVAFNQLPM